MEAKVLLGLFDPLSLWDILSGEKRSLSTFLTSALVNFYFGSKWFQSAFHPPNKYSCVKLFTPLVLCGV